MCNFLSLIVTDGNIYYLLDDQSHSGIIRSFNLIDDPNVIIKIEAIPKNYNTMTDWTITVDQDIRPKWFDFELSKKAVLDFIEKIKNDVGIERLQIVAVQENGNSIQYLNDPSGRFRLQRVRSMAIR